MSRLQLDLPIGDSSVMTVSLLVKDSDSSSSLARSLVQQHHLPVHLQAIVDSTIKDYQRNQTQEREDQRAMDLIQSADRSSAADLWSAAFKQETTAFREAESEEFSSGFSFIAAYQQLMLSPALRPLLLLEQSYAASVGELLSRRDKSISEARGKHDAELSQMSQRLGESSATSRMLADLADDHAQRLQMLESNWHSQISNMKEMQRREHRQIMTVLFRHHQHNTLQSLLIPDNIAVLAKELPVLATLLKQESLSRSEDVGQREAGRQEHVPPSPRRGIGNAFRRFSSLRNTKGQQQQDEVETQDILEESFTVHLGSQMKKTHNLRLLTADCLDVCRGASFDVLDQVQAQRLLTSLSLYSLKLSAIILLVDDKIDRNEGVRSEFSRTTEMTTDFHFSDIQEQMKTIRDELGDKYRLEKGDFYVTKHSNLSDTQVVLHLVINEDEVLGDSFSTRSSVMTGLRNIVRFAFQNSICKLTVPLLLCPTFVSETMTAKWYLRRAELVLKCFKGFIMENTMHSNSEPRTFQFLLPPETPPAVFDAIRDLLSSIYRVSLLVKQ